LIAHAKHDHPEASVRWLCQMFGVNRSWYLHENRSAPTASLEEDTRLRNAIERLCLDFPGYGYRRVTAQLHRDGWTVNHKRVLSVMQTESLLCRLQRAFRPPSAGSTKAAYPNLTQDLAVTQLDQVWAADVTYIRLPQGFVYLACVLNAFSRRVIGWHLAKDIDTRLTLMALNKAIAARRPRAGLIHHSDRGVQYASADYVTRLIEIGASPSMSKAGCPYDNAKAESFFKTLKKEEVYLSQYHNLEEARASLSAFLDAVYNVKRLHSSLGYLPPTEFETQFREEPFAKNLARTSSS